MFRFEALQLFAHSPNAQGEWHDLEAHLRGVAQLAGSFALKFNSQECAAHIGLLHDLGKATSGEPGTFQDYLLRSVRKDPTAPARGPDHASAGAIYLRDRFGTENPVVPLMMNAIAGHHRGLNLAGQVLEQLERAERNQGKFLREAIKKMVPQLSLADSIPDIPSCISPYVRDAKRGRARFETWGRMIFSALVDADRLDTEAHGDRGKASARQTWPALQELNQRFHVAYAAQHGSAPMTLVNSVRREVYEACLNAARQSPGFFRLTVPTGGGKTLSSLGFALDHAAHHGLERVIYAIPFTSIVEQVVDEFELKLGNHTVLEHHSAAAEPADGVTPVERMRLGLATENWDAPIVVTTTVQLFESMFAHKPSPCRKLHNLARSVIVLDEVQTLPPEFLITILDGLQTLVDDYCVTVVLCTATQPALEDPAVKKQLTNVREIVPSYVEHFAKLRRVQIEVPAVAWNFAEFAQNLAQERQTLAILNTKGDAQRVLELMPEREGLFHLSTALCGAHRRQVLAEVKQRLKDELPCRLIATQVVEAGVDLDFPSVYRVMGPLDRIMQAAGRCNRSGHLAGLGRVTVVKLEDSGMPSGSYGSAFRLGLQMLEEGFDWNDPASFQRYFARYYKLIDLDKHKIQSLRNAFNYPEVAEKFRMISEDTVPVLVDYELKDLEMQKQKKEGLDLLARGDRSRKLFRFLQPFIVTVRRSQLKKIELGLTEILPGLYQAERAMYNSLSGLDTEPFDVMSIPYIH